MENITKAKATSLEHVDLTVADSQLSISQRFKFTFCSVFHLLHHFAIQLNHLLHWGQTSRDCFRTTKIAAQQVEELHEISINAVSWRPGSQKKRKKKRNPWKNWCSNETKYVPSHGQFSYWRTATGNNWKQLLLLSAALCLLSLVLIQQSANE